MSITDSFDARSEAVLNPCELIKPVEGFPENVAMSFSRKLIALVAGMEGARQIAELRCSSMVSPVYAVNVHGKDVAVYMSMLGSAGAAMWLEEAIAMGGRRFLAFGSCGCLVDGIGAGHILLPTAAYRDEGTSYHYAPPADFIEIAGADKLAGILDELGVPYTRTRTWTTDGAYRETRANMARRVEQGCGVVEMECAALAAVAAYRGAEFMQFLYGADSLAGASWDKRILGGMPDDMRARYMTLALETASRM